MSWAGFADRITVAEGLSPEIEFPEPVQMCVSEIIGTLAGSEGAGAVLRDARERLVKLCSSRTAAPPPPSHVAQARFWKGCRTTRRCGSGLVRPAPSRWSRCATCPDPELVHAATQHA